MKKEIQETTVKSDDPTVLSVNSSSIQKEAEKQALANKVSGKQLDNETDPWWLDLPYVLVCSELFLVFTIRLIVEIVFGSFSN